MVELEEIARDTDDHVVHFYERESELAQTVGRYLADAAQAGAAGIVIATEGHCAAIVTALEAAGADPAGGCASGTLILLDAAVALAGFLTDGRIDRDAFRQLMSSVVRQAGHTGRPVRVYGEMVAVLWDAGNVPAALELEELWNELGHELEFTLLCGYSSASVNGAEHAEALQQVCRLHSSILPPAGGNDLAASSRADTRVSAEFPADRTSARAARQFVTDSLAEIDPGSPLVDDARLVVTELAANAIVHARSPFSVLAHVHESGVRLAVRDHSPVRPTVRPCDPLAASGRGLQLVAALSADWGVDVTADGKTVWAEIQA